MQTLWNDVERRALFRQVSVTAAGSLLFAALSLDAQQPPSGEPPERAHQALVYDESQARVLLAGGGSPRPDGTCCKFYNDLWAWDGHRWTLLSASGEPMSGLRLVYDTHARRVVAFGGHSDGRMSSELRVLDGSTWRVVGRHPTMATAEPGLVFDARRRRFVAFGGAAAEGGAHGETWEYDGTDWTKLESRSPGKRQAHAMIFDERRGVTVVYGGIGPGGRGMPEPPTFGDLWEFDGASWSERTPTGGPAPSARHSSGVAYDVKRGMMILFGGIDASGFLGDTWGWDGRAWTMLANASAAGPEARAMGYLAYDKSRDRVILFGGRKGWPNGDLNDTWEWDGTSWRRAVP